MIGFAARRLVQLPLILLVIYTLTFCLAWLIPGNPLEGAQERRPPPEIVQAMLEQYRLDSPWSFYWDYLSKASGAAWLVGRSPRPFDLGPSLAHPDWTVNEILGAGLPVSVALGMLAMLLALAIGVSAGVAGAMRPGSLLDVATLGIALVGVSLPAFVVGTAMLVVFGVWLRAAPVGGWGGLSGALLPAVTLALPYAAYIARLTRMAMIEELGSDYVRTARAKGAGPARVVIRHALRNAFLPVLSYIGPAAASAMTGSFVVERIFAVPGIGTHFVNAVLGKDLTLIMGVVLTYSTILILFNLAVDLLYRWTDPRISL
jgi:oligopeptide transport system permease protein